MPSTDPLSPGSRLAAAALKGEPQACYRLACLCLEGALPPYGVDLAIPLLERAAKRGHAEARKKLRELKLPQLSFLSYIARRHGRQALRRQRDLQRCCTLWQYGRSGKLFCD